MNLKLLKYNIYLMGTLSTLIWGLEKNPEITEAMKNKAQPVLEHIKKESPALYSSISNITSVLSSSVDVEKNEDKKESSETNENKTKNNEKSNFKLVKNDNKYEVKKSGSDFRGNSASAIGHLAKLDGIKTFTSSGFSSPKPMRGAETILTGKPMIRIKPSNVGIINKTNVETPAPLIITCPVTQENIDNICVDLPQIQAVSYQSIKTVNDIKIPLILSDERYNCDNLTFIYDTEYIDSSDLTIVKESSNCFLKIKPSLNKAGSTSIGIKLSHNSKNIETLFDLELISLTDVQLETFPSIIPKDLEFTPKVKGTFSDGSSEEISEKMVWESTNTSVIGNLSEQVLHAKTVGSSLVKANIKEFNVEKSIESQAWHGMFLSDYYVKGFLNSEIQLKAFVFLTNGSIFDLTKYINWLSYQEEVVHVEKGNSKMQGVGIAKIDSFFANQQKTAYIDVDNKQIATVDIIGSSILTPWGQTSYKIIANFDDSTSQDISSLVDLTVADPTLASISNNVLLPLALGTTTLVLSIGELSFEKDIYIELNTLNSIRIHHAKYLAYKKQKINYKVYGIYSNGQEFDLTDQANLNLSSTTLASLSDKLLSVTNATNEFGEATLTTLINGVTGTTKVFLNPATISSTYIHVSGNLSVGSNYQLKVLANLSDGGLADLTSISKFSSSDDNVISVSNGHYNLGKIYGMKLGNANIVAEVNGENITKNIIVDELNTIKDQGYGLTAEYYSGKTFTTYKGKRLDKNINFNWSNNIKAPMGVTNAYSVRWTGKFKAPSTMNYYFCTDSDDGVRLWINNVLIINSYTDHALKRDCSGVVALTKDQKVDLKLDFFENSGFAVIRLYKGSNTASQNIIPMEDLFPE